MKAWNYVISDYHNNELSSVNKLHECKLISMSRTREQYFVSINPVYSTRADNKNLMWIC
jgi:hypothetical protein